jgi:uncharacterized membrane protein YeaQ/YmgE (transglycosylase-associated protein family)
MKIMFISKRAVWPGTLAAMLGAAVCFSGNLSLAQNETSAPAAGERMAAATNQAKEFIQEHGQAAVESVQTLWQRIDEKRLKNRTADEVVAMVIMGMLVGGLLYRFGKRGPVMSVIFGLIGAFIGGIVANVTQVNLGLGPILITYEDLLFSLLGAVLMICGARWSSIMKLVKKPLP